jgi:hypothetical protein
MCINRNKQDQEKRYFVKFSKDRIISLREFDRTKSQREEEEEEY